MMTSERPRGTLVERYLPSWMSAEIAWPVFDSSGEKLIVPAGIGTPSTATVPSTVLTGYRPRPHPAPASRQPAIAPAINALIAPPDYRTRRSGSTTSVGLERGSPP